MKVHPMTGRENVAHGSTSSVVTRFATHSLPSITQVLLFRHGGKR